MHPMITGDLRHLKTRVRGPGYPCDPEPRKPATEDGRDRGEGDGHEVRANSGQTELEGCLDTKSEEKTPYELYKPLNPKSRACYRGSSNGGC